LEDAGHDDIEHLELKAVYGVHANRDHSYFASDSAGIA